MLVVKKTRVRTAPTDASSTELDKRKALLVTAKTCKMAFDLEFSSMGLIVIEVTAQIN